MQAAVINTTHHKWLTCYVLGWDVQTGRHTQKCTHEATNFGSMTSTWTWLCVHGQVALHPKKESFGEMTFTSLPGKSEVRIMRLANIVAGLKNRYMGFENSRRILNSESVLKSLKVFRLKAAILGLQFVKSMMFNCSYFDKSILNVYSPMSPKMFLGPAVGQRCPA